MQARNALQDGEISWLTLQDLFDRLPSDHLDRGDEFNQDASALPPKSYTVGGFAHSSFMGLRRHTLRSPWFTTLLTSIIRYISPGHCFTTVTASRNVMTLMHMDNHNEEWSSNLVVPFSEYLAGQVWIACPDGDVQLVAHGQLGNCIRHRLLCALIPDYIMPQLLGRVNDMCSLLFTFVVLLDSSLCTCRTCCGWVSSL